MDYQPKIDPADMCWMHLEVLVECGCDYEELSTPVDNYGTKL